MAVLSSSLSIFSLNKTANETSRNSVFASKTLRNINQIIGKRTKVKRDAFLGIKREKDKREEDERRKQRQDEIEAPNVVSRPGGPQQLVQADSPKGFFDRIFGFLGYLAAGWIMNNLPTWIAMGKEFIARLQKAGEIVSGFFNNTIKLFSGVGNLLGSIGQNLISLDLFDTSNRVKNSFAQLNSTVAGLGNQIEEAFGILTTPLTEGKYSGQDIPKVGTEQTDQGAYPESDTYVGQGGGGRWKPLLDLIHSVESSTDKKNNGYDAQNGAPGGVRPGLSQMTIGEIARNAPGASGRYQQMPQYLLRRAKAAGFNENTVFTPAVQDALAVKLIEGRGGNSWLSGRMKTEDFMQSLSQEWAALPNAYGSFYYRGQSSSLRPERVKAALSQVKSGSSQQQPQISSSNGASGNAIFGETGNVRNAPNWVHGHFQTNTGTANDVVNDTAPIVKGLLNAGIIPELSGGQRFSKNMSMEEIKKLIRLGLSQHGHSGDGRSVDIFVPKGTKVPFPVYDVRNTGGRGGVTAILPGTGKVWVGHLDPKSKSGGTKPTEPSSLAQIATSQQRQEIPISLTPERRAQDIIVAQPPNKQNIIATPSGDGGQQISSPISDFDLLNNFMKNKLLLDLAYL